VRWGVVGAVGEAGKGGRGWGPGGGAGKMFKNTFQSGFLSILYSIGSKPLQIWDKKGKRNRKLKPEKLTLTNPHTQQKNEKLMLS
jgi:hypothetical protein